MVDQPLISVIIPCYNAENYVEEAVRSIMSQTYKNLEIICINDCSTDNTVSILGLLAEEDSRVVVYKNDKNLKVSKTFNKGLQCAKGLYIARMDADDIALPNRLERQINFLLKNSKVDVVGSNIQSIDAKGNRNNYHSKVPLEHDEIIEKLYYKCCMMNPSILAKKSFFLDLGGYRDIDFGEDYDLWIRSTLSGKILHNLEDILLLYRSHDNNLTNKAYSSKHAIIIQRFLFEHMLASRKPKFILGIIVQTYFFYHFIHKTSKIRFHFKKG